MITTSMTTIIVAIGALVVPPVVSFLKNIKWSPQIKQLIAGLLSLGIGALGIWIVAPKDFGLPLASLGGLIYAGSQAVYGLYFKGSSVDTILTNALYKNKTTTTKTSSTKAAA